MYPLILSLFYLLYCWNCNSFGGTCYQAYYSENFLITNQHLVLLLYSELTVPFVFIGTVQMSEATSYGP
jgi:hypothetical protein